MKLPFQVICSMKIVCLYIQYNRAYQIFEYILEYLLTLVALGGKSPPPPWLFSGLTLFLVTSVLQIYNETRPGDLVMPDPIG